MNGKLLRLKVFVGTFLISYVILSFRNDNSFLAKFQKRVSRLILVQNECVKNFKVFIDASSDKDIVLRLTNDGLSSNAFETNSKKQVKHMKSELGFVSGVPDEVKEEHLNTHWNARRVFSLSLGDAENYQGKFRLNGEDLWPVFGVVKSINETPFKCRNYFAIRPPRINLLDIDENTCQLARNGNFQKVNKENSEWYHMGGGLDIASQDLLGGNKALTTVNRFSPEDGLVHFLNTSCLVHGQHYKINGIVKLVSADNSEIPICDPLRVEIDEDRCPRGNLFYSNAGSKNGYRKDDIAFTSEFKPGGWSKFWGYFIVNEHMAFADLVAFTIDGPKAGVNIVLDDMTIVPVVPSERDCIMNGDFVIGDTRFWQCHGHGCKVELESPGKDGSDYAIKMVDSVSAPLFNLLNHHENFWLKFTIDSDCLDPTKMYEVNAWFKLQDKEGNEVFCNPFLYYSDQEDSCPNISIKKEGNSQLASEQIRAATTVGPLKEGEWNRMYGFIDGEEMAIFLSWAGVNAYVGPTKRAHTIVLDNVSIEQSDAETFGISTCTQLIKNGDADVGDARFWFIQGPSGKFGTINLVSPGAGGSQYAFAHNGDRTNHNQGMWQELEKACMPVGSTWVISAKFKTNYKCVKTKHIQSDSCPMFSIEARDEYAKNPIRVQLNNENKSPYKWEWNTFQATFTVSTGLASLSKIFISVLHPVGKNYQLDDMTIKMENFVS